MHRLSLLPATLLVTACFSPEAPVESDTTGESGDSSTSSGPTSGPPVMTGSANTNDTDPSGPTASDTEGMTDTNPSSTDPTETDPTETGSTDTDPSDTDTTTSGGADCGDGEVEGDEVCDDGVNDGSYDGCANDCSALGPRCGDGEENGPEQCDDGDEVQGNGCNNDCVPSGVELWTYEEHISPSDSCVDIATADGGQIYMAGQVDNLDGADDADAIYVQRLTEEGNVAWSREYAPLATSTTHDYDAFAATASAGGVVVVGAHRTTVSAFSTFTDVPAVLFSEDNGDIVWERSDDFVDFAGGVITDDDGTFVVAATTTTDFDVYLYRLSADGDPMGNTDVDTNRRARALALDPEGSYIVASEEQTATTDAVFQRRNQGFGPLWEITPAGLRSPRGVAVGAMGQVFAVGALSGEGPWVARRQPSGADEWIVYTDDVAALGDPSAVAPTADGGLVVVGTRSGAPWIARLGPDGGSIWSRSADENGLFVSVAPTPEGDFVACGTVDGGGQGDNIFVARYTQ